MLIKVKVFPGAKKEGIVKKSAPTPKGIGAAKPTHDRLADLGVGAKSGEEDSFEIKVKEKPQMGKANKAVIALLSYYFEVPRHKIRMVKGARVRNKIFEIKE